MSEPDHCEEVARVAEILHRRFCCMPTREFALADPCAETAVSHPLALLLWGRESFRWNDVAEEIVNALARPR
jgi:hypothetical protein